MKILYDYQTFEQQNHGGISRYFYELFKQIEEKKTHTYELPLRYSSNVYIKELPLISSNLDGPADYYKNFISKKEFPGKFKLYSLYRSFFTAKFEKNKSASINSIKECDYDIFHPTYYDPYFLSVINKKPFVITIYDMIHELFPDHFPKGDQTSAAKEMICKQATQIIAISDNTKKDLIRLWGIDPNKIEVIHLATSLKKEIGYSIPSYNTPYFLFVGNRSSYKNFKFVVEASIEILKNTNTHLVCCGGGDFNNNEKAMLDELKLSNHVHFVDANDQVLANMYSNAIAFIFPSLYEGFGIPVLEAFSCDCPCLLSTGGSLPEIGGNAAAYFDPKQPEQLNKLMLKCLESKEYRENLIAKGSERVKLFTWENTYFKTIDVYKCLI